MIVELAVEMRDGRGYASVHRAGCRDLRDPEGIGEHAGPASAAARIESTFGWEAPFHFAPCTGFSGDV